MTSHRRKQFERAYQDALNLHLLRKMGSRQTSRTARKIGQEAAALGLNAMDLALIHDRSTRSLKSPKPLRPRKKPFLSPAAIFYIEALAPLERIQNALRANGQTESKKLERQLSKDINRRRKLLAESQRHQDQARQLSHQLLLVQEKEVKEMSRELDDEIAQVLAGINVRLVALKELTLQGRDGIGHYIDQTQKLVDQSVSAVQRYALRLRPTLLDDLGLVPSLRSCIRNLPGRKGLCIRLSANSEARCLNNEQRTALYRFAQEALTNVTLHARAKNVYVSLQKRPDQISLVVRDDGKSFNEKRILNSLSNRIKGLGLLGIRERVEMLGGLFSIVSTPEQGTSIRAEFPMKSVPLKSASWQGTSVSAEFSMKSVAS